MSNPCINCGHPLREGASFCVKCGTRQPAPKPQTAPSQIVSTQKNNRSCPECGREDIDRLVRFCPGCKYDLHTQKTSQSSRAKIHQKVQAATGYDLPHNVREYEALVDDVADDGVLEKDEHEELEKAKIRLKISEAKHEQLMTKYPDLIIGIPFRFQLEIDSFKNLKTGYRGMGVVRFIASQRFSDCTIYGWSATDEERLQDKRFFTVRPRKKERWSMGMYPDVPGYYEMQYVLEFKLSNRKVVHFVNETPIHLMVPREGDTIQNVNISFGEKAVGQINDLNLQQQSGDSGFRRQDNWQEIDFRPLGDQEFEYWKSRKSGQEFTEPRIDPIVEVAPAPEPIVEPEPIVAEPLVEIVPEPIPEPEIPQSQCYDTLRGALCTQFEIVWEIDGEQQKVQACLKKKAVFGRAFGRGTEALDVKLAVEPILDWTVNSRRQFVDENANRSLKISGKHFEVRSASAGAFIVDVGSSNGTKINNQPLGKHVPTKITELIKVSVGGVLDLTLSPLYTASRSVGGILIGRPSNSSHKSYALINHSVGVWLDSPCLFGDAFRGHLPAPLTLELSEEGEPILTNNSCSFCVVDGQKLNIEDSIVLRGDILVLEVEDEIFALQRS